MCVFYLFWTTTKTDILTVSTPNQILQYILYIPNNLSSNQFRMHEKLLQLISFDYNHIIQCSKIQSILPNTIRWPAEPYNPKRTYEKKGALLKTWNAIHLPKRKYKERKSSGQWTVVKVSRKGFRCTDKYGSYAISWGSFGNRRK